MLTYPTKSSESLNVQIMNSPRFTRNHLIDNLRALSARMKLFSFYQKTKEAPAEALLMPFAPLTKLRALFMAKTLRRKFDLTHVKGNQKISPFCKKIGDGSDVPWNSAHAIKALIDVWNWAFFHGFFFHFCRLIFVIRFYRKLTFLNYSLVFNFFF